MNHLGGTKSVVKAAASVTAAVLAADRGARLLRVHDVAATKQGLAVWAAMQAQDMQTAMG